eukprot:5330051-Amphidinium_carterae.1
MKVKKRRSFTAPACCWRTTGGPLLVPLIAAQERFKIKDPPQNLVLQAYNASDKLALCDDFEWMAGLGCVSSWWISNPSLRVMDMAVMSLCCHDSR